MSFETQDVIQESPAAQSVESGSLYGEAYGLISQQQLGGTDRTQASSRSEANQTFGALEIFDPSNDGQFTNDTGRKPAGAGKSGKGNIEKIDAAISENEDGTIVMEYADGKTSTISKDGEVVRDFDAQGRQITDPGKDTSDFDKDGKIGPDAGKDPVQVKPEEVKRAVDDLLQRGVLPDIEFFEKRGVPRDDGEIRQRQEPDKNGGVKTTTDYPNGITVAKVQQTVRGDDGRLTKVEETSIKGPEGFRESPKGTYVDKTGKPLAKENEDGTLTVFIEDHGKQKTVTEFPNGVRTVTGDVPTIVRDGRVVQMSRNDTFPEGSSFAPDGTVIDKKGNPIAKANEDGSLTIFTPGGTYTQHADGKVTFKKQEGPAKKK